MTEAWSTKGRIMANIRTYTAQQIEQQILAYEGVEIKLQDDAIFLFTYEQFARKKFQGRAEGHREVFARLDTLYGTESMYLPPTTEIPREDKVTVYSYTVHKPAFIDCRLEKIGEFNNLEDAAGIIDDHLRVVFVIGQTSQVNRLVQDKVQKFEQLTEVPAGPVH